MANVTVLRISAASLFLVATGLATGATATGKRPQSIVDQVTRADRAAPAAAQTVTGFGLSASIFQVLIARATSLPVILPSAASAATAACAM